MGSQYVQYGNDIAIWQRVLKQVANTSNVHNNKFVRPRWPYDMRPSARAEKYTCVIVIR